MFLAKNPASLTTNLKVFEKRKSEFDALLFILNDNIPDGRDVSWIYDVDPSVIFSACKDKEIYVSGGRVYDMAVRLDYAEVFIPEENVSASVQSITNLIKRKSSVMLDFRNMLVGRKIL
ncbi:MAG: UDP-N-acetylmuramyl tripeptide synthetase [candidate division WWE3 bacterium GW2011_GWF2_41_45]|nr:MAG: UDP-N-acetylmuramyl tripeptide synthetase [candidate division WWE3 bacterium GW2011_GWF2_41_45]